MGSVLSKVSVLETYFLWRPKFRIITWGVSLWPMCMYSVRGGDLLWGYTVLWLGRGLRIEWAGYISNF